jgi:hypothetical protein
MLCGNTGASNDGQPDSTEPADPGAHLRRRRDLDPFDRRGQDDGLQLEDLPRLFGRLVRRGRIGAAVTFAAGLILSAGGGFGTWKLGPWSGILYPWGLLGSVMAVAVGLWGVSQGGWFLVKPHPLAVIPDVKTFVHQLVASAHPVTVCTRCRRLLEGADPKSCDRCLSAADLFTARSQADHRVIFATLPKDP